LRKIFTATLGTETNTFSALPTGLQLFRETCLFRKANYGAEVPMFGAPLAVWRRRAEERGWQVVESLCAFAQPAGRTVKKVYEAFRDEILADLRAAMPVDAVLLSMHGAMVAEGYDDCEGDLLRAVRAIVGPNVPVGAELDLHCHVSETMVENATALVLFKEYPHVDVPERAEDLFTLIADAVEGRTRPVMAMFDCRMIGVFHTTREPMRGFVDRLSSMEGKDGVLSLSAGHSFPWGDVPELGCRLVAVADGDKAKAERLARQLGMEFYALRKAAQPAYVSLDQAIARAATHNLPKPMVLADVSDNAGGGAASDSTFILKAMLDRGIRDAAIGMFWDPMTVRLAEEAGEGATLELRLGGKIGPASGPPLDVRATVLKVAHDVKIAFGGARKSVGPIGDAVALEIEGITVIVNTKRTQCLSLDCFTGLGIDPAAKKVVVVKSMQHFHAAYAPIASEVVYVAAPGALVPEFDKLPYTKIDRGMWPFTDAPFAEGLPGAAS
jgi:microcystin degradation protein MlrC